MATVDDVRVIALSLPRAYEALVRDRVKFRVGRIVFVSFSRDETLMGFGFPREERAALVASDPETFLMPIKSDERYQWVRARLAALDVGQMRELVVDAWQMCVPKRVAAQYWESRFLTAELPVFGASNLPDIAAAVRASWSAGTCDPAARDQWRETNPAHGQCGVSALVINDLLGGDLMLAEVLWPDGSKQRNHYWNRLPGGAEVDVTIEQFLGGERVQPGRAVPRPPGPPRRCRPEYELLQARVAAHLRIQSRL